MDHPILQAKARRLAVRRQVKAEWASRYASPADGKITGDSTEWVGLFIRLPAHLAARFPERQSDKDSSPRHVTLLYVGNVKGKETGFVETCQRIISEELRGPVTAHLEGLDYFTHPAQERRVAILPVRFSHRMAELRDRLKSAIEDLGIQVGDSYTVYRPHATLDYIDGLDSEYTGPIPKGGWMFDEIEIWGMPQVHKLKVGSTKVAARPIPIDKAKVMTLAQKIMRELPKHLRFQDDPTDPLHSQRGYHPKSWGFRAGQYRTEDVMGSPVTVAVAVGSKRRQLGFHGSRQYIAGGFFRAIGHVGEKGSKYLMGVTLDSSKSPQQILANLNQVQKEVYSVLIHEVTHLRDVIKIKKPREDTEDFQGKAQGYYSDFSEVRAFMQQIVDEVIIEVERQGDADLLWGGVHLDSLESLLGVAPTWNRVQSHLTPRARKILLKGVFTGFRDALPRLQRKYPGDSWNEDEDATYRVARHYLAKSFTLEIGDPVLTGKYLNSKGHIIGFKKGDKGDPVAIVETEPDKDGKTRKREVKIFKLRLDESRERKKASSLQRGSSPTDPRRAGWKAARMFPTEDALKQYLREHPGADKSKHQVEDRPKGDARPKGLGSKLRRALSGSTKMVTSIIRKKIERGGSAASGIKKLLSGEKPEPKERAHIARALIRTAMKGGIRATMYTVVPPPQGIPIVELAMRHATEILDRKLGSHFGVAKVGGKLTEEALAGMVLDSIREATGHVEGKTAARLAAKYQKKKQVPKADGKGTTTVYEYTEGQVQHRNREKAKRVEKLRNSIDRLRKQVKKDLKSSDEKTRMQALCVGLMDETYERVGNEESAKDGHFGVTGWKVKHLTISGGKATLKYVGKSGVGHDKVVTDAGLVAALKAAKEGKGENDSLTGTVGASEVNAYLRPYGITAKDMRGYHANAEMQSRLKAIRSKGGDLPADPKEREKKLKKEFEQALNEAAKAVGHEPSTLKGQYLVPGLADNYLAKGKVMGQLDKRGAHRLWERPQRGWWLQTIGRDGVTELSRDWLDSSLVGNFKDVLNVALDKSRQPGVTRVVIRDRRNMPLNTFARGRRLARGSNNMNHAARRVASMWLRRKGSGISPLALRMIQAFARKGKSAEVNLNIMAEALTALGWQVEETVGVVRPNYEFWDHPNALQKFGDATGAHHLSGPGSYNDEGVFQYTSQAEAEAALRAMPQYVTITGSKKAPARPEIGKLYVGIVSKDITDHTFVDTYGDGTIYPDFRLSFKHCNFGVKGWRLTNTAGKSGTIVPNLDRGKVVDAAQVKISQLFTWGYKNGLQQDAQRYMETGGSDAMEERRKKRELELRSLDNTGTCGVCGANVKMTRAGKLMRHGWRVQGGGWQGYGSWHSASCFGTGYQPFELSPKGAIEYRKAVLITKVHIQERIKELESSNPPIHYRKKDINPGDRGYERAKEQAHKNAKKSLRDIVAEIRTLDAKIAGWSQQPLPGERTASENPDMAQVETVAAVWAGDRLATNFTFEVGPQLTAEGSKRIRGQGVDTQVYEAALKKRYLHAGDAMLGVAGGRMATKSDAERENEEVERLNRSKPTKKPPRKDLMRGRIKVDDPDLSAGGADKDRDLSLNYKKVAVREAGDRLLMALSGPRFAGKVPGDAERKREGDYWQTENGWGVWPPGAKQPTSAPDEPAARRMAEGTEGKVDPEAEAQAEEEDRAKARRRQQNKQQRQLADFDKAIKGLDLNELGDMDERAKAELAEAFSAHMDHLTRYHASEKGFRSEALKAADRALRKQLKGLGRKKPEAQAEMLAEYVFAQKVVADPTVVGGISVKDEQKTATQLHARAKDAYQQYVKAGPTLMDTAAKMLEKKLSEMDPDSDEHIELDAIKSGMILAAAVQGRQLPGSKGVSKSFQTLAQALATLGEQDMLLKGGSEFYGPNGRSRVREALDILADDELVEVVAGENSPYGPIGAALLDDSEDNLMGADQRAFARDLLKMLAVNDMTTTQGFINALGGEDTKDGPTTDPESLAERVRSEKGNDQALKDAASELADCLAKAETQEDLEKCKKTSNDFFVRDMCSTMAAAQRVTGEQPDRMEPDVARVRHVCDTGDISVLDQEVERYDSGRNVRDKSVEQVKADWLKKISDPKERARVQKMSPEEFEVYRKAITDEEENPEM